MSVEHAVAAGTGLVLRDEAEGVVTLTLNRPQQQNALCEAMLEELQAALDAIVDDENVRVVVLAGAPPSDTSEVQR